MPEPTPLRKIIHIDMDAFFASVEQRDFPEYRGKPLVVGSSQKRGVVAAASYEARKYGIHSAMPSAIAARKCPYLIFAKSRFEVYREVSKQIREVFHEYTDLVEPLSLDEAYLDVTENRKGATSATLLAREIKKRILEVTQLTASAGVSFNKFLAKIASDMDKPNGLYVITPEQANPFLEKLPIEKFHGIGKVTAQKMRKFGILKGEDLKRWSREQLVHKFGKVGHYYFHIVRGIDPRPVNPNRIRKSIGAERTFAEDKFELNDMQQALLPIVEEVYQRSIKQKAWGRTFTLKVKFADFTQITRSKSQTIPLHSLEQLQSICFRLLEETFPEMEQGVRLLGFTMANLERPTNAQGTQLLIPFEGWDSL